MSAELIVPTETGSAVKPRFRSDHTSWLTAPVRTAIRGVRSTESSAGSDARQGGLEVQTPLLADRVERRLGGGIGGEDRAPCWERSAGARERRERDLRRDARSDELVQRADGRRRVDLEDVPVGLATVDAAAELRRLLDLTLLRQVERRRFSGS